LLGPPELGDRGLAVQKALEDVVRAAAEFRIDNRLGRISQRPQQIEAERL
jgi:hypothetical protein